MKAIIFDGNLKYLTDYPIPAPRENEALMRVRLAGICNTDMEILRGYLGFHGVVGHEFTGVVEKAPEPASALIGKRVVGEINCGCCECDFCRTGLERHCPDRTTLGILGRDGAFADYVALPVANLRPVPDSVSDVEAVFTEPLAAAFEITEQAHIRPTEEVLVLGDGKLGLLCSFVLDLTGAHVTLAGRHATKLNLAANRGIDTVCVSMEALSEKRRFDVVVEATGSIEGFETALKHTRPRGRIVLKSTVAGTQSMNLAPLVIDEITLVGSRCGSFGPALRALTQKHIDVTPLVSGIYAFEHAREAFEKAQEKESLKTLIDFR